MKHQIVVFEHALKEDFTPTGADMDPAQHKRIAGLWNRFIVGLKGDFRAFYKGLNPFRMAPDLLTAVTNTSRIVYRIGTGKNPALRRDFERLMHAVSAGQIKTGKEFNAAKNQILQAHGLKAYKTNEQAE